MRTLRRIVHATGTKTYAFTVVFDVRASATAELHEGDVALSPDLLDELVEHGAVDATFGRRQGAFYAAFDRTADSLPDAITSAIEDLESCDDVFVLRVEPEEMVNAATIAARLGKSREGIRLWAMGARGPGNFPEPRFYLGEAANPIWTWSSVAAWHAHYAGEPEDEAVRDATFLAYINVILELRRFSEHFATEGLGERPRDAIHRILTAAVQH